MKIIQIFSIGCVGSIWLGAWLELDWQLITASVVAMVVLSALMAVMDILYLGVFRETFSIEFTPDDE